MRGEFSDYVIWWIAVGVLVEVAFAVPTKCPEQWSEILRNPDDCNPGTVCESSSNAPGCEVRKFHRRTRRTIQAGAGYSNDLEQITPQRCFNVIESPFSEPQGSILLDSAMTSSELADELGLSTSISGGYGIFSADAEAKYMRSLEGTDNTISFNYCQYSTVDIALQIGGYGDKALTESGKGFYKNGTNPYFGVTCGDQYISSYRTGALLTMGLIIKLSCSSAKKKFYEGAGAQCGNIVSVAERAQHVSAKNNITGSVIIQAFQIGGEPSQLSKILTKNDTGIYYALSCNLQAMDNCIKTASGLLNYATENFTNQFSFKDKTGLTPLGFAFTEYNPIEWLGLNAPVSLVTSEIVQHRHDLSIKLKENQYYQQKLHHFLNRGYPVQLAKTFIDNVTSILSKADSNVRVLMKQHGGAADCFHFPERCTSIKATIDSQLQNITIGDLKFLKNIKYTFACEIGMIYNTGDSPHSWAILSSDDINIRVTRANYRSKQCSYNLTSLFRNFIIVNCFEYKEDGMKKYLTHQKLPTVRNLSPFFFEAYSPYNNWDGGNDVFYK